MLFHKRKKRLVASIYWFISLDLCQNMTTPIDIPILKSKIIKNEAYHENYKEMFSMVSTLNDRLAQATKQGSKKAIATHLKRNQLLIRDRIDLLLDEDSPFLELCPLAGWGQGEMTLGGSIVAGIGLVSGVECMITGNVPTLFGGSSNEISVAKGARIAAISMENNLPFILKHLLSDVLAMGHHHV